MSSLVKVIGTQPPIDHEIPLRCAEVEQPDTGWDTLREELWLPHRFWIRRGQVREGPGPEGGAFIVQNIRPLRMLAGRPVVEVTSLGIATQDGKDYKLTCSGSLSEDLSLASTAISPTIWRIGYPRVTKQWVSLTTPKIFDHVAVASVPPDTFGIGGGPWSMAWVSATNWAASGWVGETRVPEQLPGSKACLVTDTWLFDVGYGDRDTTPAGVIYL